MTATRSILTIGFLILGLLGAGIGHTQQSAAPAKAESGMLLGSKGMTLYTFDKDAAGSGKSACNGQCAANWPPFTASDGDHAADNWSIVTRDDGQKQWAYKGRPLYYWVKDQKPGDKTGDGFNNVWHVAKE